MASCSPLQSASGSTPGDAESLISPRRPLDPRHQIHKIQRALEAKLSKDSKLKLQSILDKVNALNDVEKFLLYLQLPTGISSPSSPYSGSLPPKTEQTHAETWISSHLEVDPDTCMPKSEIYDDYKMFCERHKNKWLNIGDFNRLLKSTFPLVKARRLGNRGQSRYCFSGIRARGQMTAPSLPLIHTTEVTDSDDESLDVSPAASDVICQWATKLFSQPFTSIALLGKYLIANNYVSSNTLNAFTVLADPSPSAGDNQAEPHEEPTVTSPGESHPRLDQHRALQLKLQRKLQERATLNEQKKRMEEQRSQSTGKKAEDKPTELRPKVEGELKEAPKAKPPPPLQKRILPKISCSQSAYTMSPIVSTAPVKPVLLLSPSNSVSANHAPTPLVIMNSPSSVIQLQQKPPLAPTPSVQFIATPSMAASPDPSSSSSPSDVLSPRMSSELEDEDCKSKESTISSTDLASVIPGISQTTLASLTKKSKSTPVKPRVSGKTISDLLKSQRRAIGQPDKKYANDRRPVAQLLRESRQQKSPQMTSSQPFVIQALSLNNKSAPPLTLQPSSSSFPSSSSSTNDSQLKQMLSQQWNNPKLRDLLTGRDDISAPLLQAALKSPNAVPPAKTSNGVRGSQRDLRRLHPDLKAPASSVSFADCESEALNQEVQELCSRAGGSFSSGAKRAASEPPTQSVKKQAMEQMPDLQPDDSWDNSVNELRGQGTNDLGPVPSDLVDVMPSIPQMLEADHSLNALRLAASMISSNIEPLLLSDSMEQLMMRPYQQQQQQDVVVSMLNDPSPSPSYSSTASTPMMSPNNASFMPISSSTAQCDLMSPVRPILTSVPSQNPKLEPDILQEFNKAQLFAPASSIKPVKRGKGRGKARATRQRHHSAQDSILLRSSLLSQQTQPLSLPPPPAPPPPQPVIVTPLETGNNLSVCVNQQLMDVPSPFSPEIQDILYGGGGGGGNSALPWFEQQSNSFRSHSVPVQFMAQGGSELPEPIDTSVDFSQQIALLQHKLQSLRQTSDARRNITQMIESEESNQQPQQQQQQPQGLSCVGRGDHLISGAPFRPPLRYALNAELKAREMYAMQGSSMRSTVPTPPSSQNPTPDFSHELPSVHYEVTTGAPGSSSSSALDTPTSLEPMVDLSCVCEEQQQAMARAGESFVWD